MSIDNIAQINNNRANKKREVKNKLQLIDAKKDDFIFLQDHSVALKGYIEKFSSDSIKISVVAEVSSGKSTFLNQVTWAIPFFKPNTPR